MLITCKFSTNIADFTIASNTNIIKLQFIFGHKMFLFYYLLVINNLKKSFLFLLFFFFWQFFLK